MRPLALDEIVERDTYGELRPGYRRAVIAHKRDRRVAVGERVTLVFEDRETLRFQVQEMLWVEGIVEPEKIQHELDVYNELMPGPRELSATLFVEITDATEIRPELDRLVGIDEHVSLVLGEDEDERRIPATFDPKQMEDDRIAAVQYIRFRLGPGEARRFAHPATRARIRIDHPNYRREAELGGPAREALVAGLEREPAPLLDPAEVAAGPGPDEVLIERAGVRALRPARPAAPGHVVVEAAGDGSLLELDDARFAALIALVREVAGRVAREYGGCRVETELGEGASGLRWHVTAR